MMPDVFLISIGLLNVVGSGLCAVYVFRSRARDTYVYWGLMHLSYALMPLFGLGDDFIGLQDEKKGEAARSLFADADKMLKQII